VSSAIVDARIDVSALLERVASDSNGAAVLFVGTVRDTNDGRSVTGIEYTAYRSMAERELASIAEEASARTGTTYIAIEHRLGELRIGECSVAVAVGHPHRGAAFEGARYVIEELKRRVPIWKREQYLDGTREWVRATSSDAHSTGGPDVDVLADAGERT
jgi:molybdopterin synthase catalytic subunit